MRVFKTKWFVRFVRKAVISDTCLVNAVRNAENGLIDAVLGGGLIKQRIPREGGGKSSGYRTIIAYKTDDKCFFLFCFAKNDKGSLDDDELKTYKNIAKSLMFLDGIGIDSLLEIGEIVEVEYSEN